MKRHRWTTQGMNRKRNLEWCDRCGVYRYLTPREIFYSRNRVEWRLRAKACGASTDTGWPPAA